MINRRHQKSLHRLARFFIATQLIVISAAATTVFAQNPQPLQHPNVALLNSGTVNVILTLTDGSAVVGGSFVSVNGSVRSNIAKRRADGTLDPNWQPMISGKVLALAADSAGNLYVGGEFATVNGIARRNLVKLTASGDVVAGWDPSPDRIVTSLVVRGTDALFVGGYFSELGGSAKAGLGKLSLSTGESDAAWNPLPANSQVLALAHSQDVMLIVGGSFSTAGGLARRNLAKLSYNGDGAADAQWNPSPSNAVSSIAVAPDASIFIAGSFSHFGDPANGGTLRMGVAKLAGGGSGSIIASWNPFPGEQFLWTQRVAVDPSGAVYLGGGFTYFGSTGETRYGVVKVSSSGAGSIDASWNPTPIGDVHAIAFSGSSILAGGTFGEAGGDTRLAFLAIGAGGNALAGDFDVESPNVTVHTVLKQPGGGTIVGGNFIKANGSVRLNLLRLNPDGSLDTVWNPIVDGQVYALAQDVAGNIYVGGRFQHVNGQRHVALAKLAAGNNGAADSTWNSESAPLIASGSISTLAMDGSGRLYFGGRFSTSSLVQNDISRTTALGANELDSGWRPHSMDGVRRILIDGDSAAFAVISRTIVNGRLMRGAVKIPLSGDGTVDSNWEAGQQYSPTASIALTGQGSIFIDLQQHSTISGAIDPAWNPLQPERAIRDVFCSPDGWLYSAESVYDSTQGTSQYFLQRRLASGTGSIDSSWNPSLNGLVLTMTFDSSATVIGGAFTQVGGHARYGIAGLPINVSDSVFSNSFESAPIP